MEPKQIYQIRQAPVKCRSCEDYIIYVHLNQYNRQIQLSCLNINCKEYNKFKFNPIPLLKLQNNVVTCIQSENEQLKQFKSSIQVKLQKNQERIKLKQIGFRENCSFMLQNESNLNIEEAIDVKKEFLTVKSQQDLDQILKKHNKFLKNIVQNKSNEENISKNLSTLCQDIENSFQNHRFNKSSQVICLEPPIHNLTTPLKRKLDYNGEQTTDLPLQKQIKLNEKESLTPSIHLQQITDPNDLINQQPLNKDIKVNDNDSEIATDQPPANLQIQEPPDIRKPHDFKLNCINKDCPEYIILNLNQVDKNILLKSSWLQAKGFICLHCQMNHHCPNCQLGFSQFSAMTKYEMATPNYKFSNIKKKNEINQKDPISNFHTITCCACLKVRHKNCEKITFENAKRVVRLRPENYLCFDCVSCKNCGKDINTQTQLEMFWKTTQGNSRLIRNGNSYCNDCSKQFN